MNSILHIPDLLQHIFEFLTSEVVMDYPQLHGLPLVNKAFADTVQRWPRFMRTLWLHMECQDAEVRRPRALRVPRRVTYDVLNVMRLGGGKLKHLKLGNMWGERHAKHVLTDRELAAIVDSAPRLRTLCVQIKTKFTSRGMQVLNAVPTLTSLELPLGKPSLVWPVFEHVKKLGITGRPRARPLANLRQVQPNVKRLRMTLVFNLHTEDFIRFGEVLPNVTELGMHMCWTDRMCVTIESPVIDFFSRLTSMHMNKCNIISGLVFIYPLEFSRIFSNLHKLVTNTPFVYQSVCDNCVRTGPELLRCNQCRLREYPNLRVFISL
jgi:hypothetical protein